MTNLDKSEELSSETAPAPAGGMRFVKLCLTAMPRSRFSLIARY